MSQLEQLKHSVISYHYQMINQLEARYSQRITDLLLQKKLIRDEMKRNFMQRLSYIDSFKKYSTNRKCDVSFPQTPIQRRRNRPKQRNNENLSVSPTKKRKLRKIDKQHMNDNVDYLSDISDVNDEIKENLLINSPKLDIFTDFTKFKFNTENIQLHRNNNNNILRNIQSKIFRKRCKSYNYNIVNFSTSTKRKKNRFDSKNKTHLKMARKQVIKNRIKILKRNDMKKYNLNENELINYINTDIMIDIIEQNQKRNNCNHNILCDICKNKMYILSEKHQNKLDLTMHISRFDHSTYHSSDNIKTLECGRCNVIRGKMDIQIFLNIINDILSNKNNAHKYLSKFEAKHNVSVYEAGCKGITTEFDDIVITRDELIQHLKQIKETQKIQPYDKIFYCVN